jgi:hypothetical protein
MGKLRLQIKEKINSFADTSEQIFTINSDFDHTFIVSTEQALNDFLKQPLTDWVRPTNHSEIAWIAHHLKPRKAGPYGILNIILQHLPHLVLKFIAKIFITSLALNYFPTQWKEAKIIMLLKPGKNHTSPLDYRPISLVNSLGKFYEKNILKTLTSSSGELKVIRNEPYSFKSGHSTMHALLRNIQPITHDFNNKKAIVALFLDTEQAFDKVWTTVLIAKLITVKIPPHLIHTIHNYLQN